MSISKFLKAVSISCLAIASCSLNSIAQAVSPRGILLTYFASQFQCGADSSLVNIEVDVYRNNQFVKTLSVNDTIYLPINSFTELAFEYNFIDAECSPIENPVKEVLAPTDPVPDVPGVYEQDSLQELLDGLNEYEELFVVELGTNEKTNSSYDLQDVVLVINNNPPYID
ncbi:MAG: hypothetical protein AB4372_34070 [Xenococcus sp. (in: cyanobacteria)]